jgi:hypothetical protein
MDSRTAKRVSEEAGYAARYDSKIKLWQIAKPNEPATLQTFTAKQLDKMTPDGLRRKLGAKPEKKAKKSAAERKPRAAFDPEAKITLLVKENPKRAGSAAHAAYALYADGMTVAAFIGAGGTYDALRWDSARKYITVGA